METQKLLACFFAAIETDGRISITHIGIFSALLQYSASHGFKNPIHAYSREIMQIAKISAPATYHKCVRELSEYGYIDYRPSFKKNRASRIFFRDN